MARLSPCRVARSCRGFGCRHPQPRPTLTCGSDLTGSGAIEADSLTATTAGGATVNLTGAITTDTGVLSITSQTTMTLGATATGQTTVTLNAGGSDQGPL